MELWVRLENSSDAEAFRVHVGYSSTVADAILAAHEIFFSPLSGGVQADSAMKPQHLQLVLRGTILSNRDQVRQAASNIVGEGSTNLAQETFVLARKTMKHLLHQAATGRGVDTPRTPRGDTSRTLRSPREPHNASMSGGETPRGGERRPSPTQIELERNRGVYGTPGRSVGGWANKRRASESPQRGRNSTPPPVKGPYFGPPRPVTPRAAVSPQRERSPDRQAYPQPGPKDDTSACVFKARWGTELCAKCGVHRRYHKKLPPTPSAVRKKIIDTSHEHAKREVSTNYSFVSPERQILDKIGAEKLSWNRRALLSHDAQQQSATAALEASSPRRVVWQGDDSADRLLSPLNSRCDGKRREHRTCTAFEPLWNNNDVCGHCYRYKKEHPISEKVRARQQQIFAQKRVAARRKARQRQTATIPWARVIAYLSTDDLFLVAQVNRRLAVMIRPILDTTMQLVLDFPRPECGQVLEDQAVHLAECFVSTSERMALLGDAVLAALHLPNDSSLDMTNFAYRIELMKQLSVVDAVTVTDGVAEAVQAISDDDFDVSDDMWPVVDFLRQLVSQYDVKRKAADYLRRDKYPL